MSSSPFAASSRGQSGSLPHLMSVMLVAPLVLLLVLAFFWPIAELLHGSLFSPNATIEHYRRIVDEPLYITILLRTVRTATIVTAACLVLAYPVAMVMSRKSGRRVMVLAACVLIPLWTSVLVRSYAWIVLLQRTGVVNALLLRWGIISEPLRLLYTEGAVILAMIHVLLPYMILPIYAALRAIPPGLDRAARNLGAGAMTAFLRVTLPLSLPGVFAGSIIVFILALGFYVTPALVGGPQNLTIATLIAQQTTELLNWPFAGALAGALLAMTLALVAVFRRFLRLGQGG